jgi:uncharacterized membrane protein YidH (DUF202 family)
MIRNFGDHSANQRTAIAVMAFGFLVAKFDLFLAAWESRQALNLKETFAHKLVHFEH